MSTLGIGTVIDLTPGDGALAITAYRRNILYVDFLFTVAHSMRLRTHIEKVVFQAMVTEDDSLYCSRLRVSLGQGNEEGDPGAAGPGRGRGSAGTSQNRQGGQRGGRGGRASAGRGCKRKRKEEGEEGNNEAGNGDGEDDEEGEDDKLSNDEE
ncbi:MAG: hypothetical protein GY772_04960 [bacterium]|nr:hypothetical protein [bacterium]